MPLEWRTLQVTRQNAKIFFTQSIVSLDYSAPAAVRERSKKSTRERRKSNPAWGHGRCLRKLATEFAFYEVNLCPHLIVILVGGWPINSSSCWVDLKSCPQTVEVKEYFLCHVRFVSTKIDFSGPKFNRISVCSFQHCFRHSTVTCIVQLPKFNASKLGPALSTSVIPVVWSGSKSPVWNCWNRPDKVLLSATHSPSRTLPTAEIQWQRNKDY